jgi:hypothetical protein
MATRTPQRLFGALPQLPTTDNVALNQWCSAVTQQLRVLTANAGDNALPARAIVRADVTVAVPETTIKACSATGSAINISGALAAEGTDHAQLVSDVKQLVADVNRLQAAVKLLTNQLKGA